MSALYVSVSCKSCSLSTSVLIILTFRRAASLHFDLRASVALQRPQRGRTTKPPRLWTPVLTEMCLNSSQTWRETDVTGQSKGKEVNDAFCAFSMRCLTTAERAAERREAGCARWLVAYRNAVVCLLVWIPVACYKRRSSSLFRGRKNHSWCSRKLHLYKQRPRDCTQNKAEMETNRRRRSGNY